MRNVGVCSVGGTKVMMMMMMAVHDGIFFFLVSAKWGKLGASGAGYTHGTGRLGLAFAAC